MPGQLLPISIKILQHVGSQQSSIRTAQPLALVTPMKGTQGFVLQDFTAQQGTKGHCRDVNTGYNPMKPVLWKNHMPSKMGLQWRRTWGVGGRVILVRLQSFDWVDEGETASQAVWTARAEAWNWVYSERVEGTGPAGNVGDDTEG